MASKKPVPSKAALNALRGVLLTTSCSVILLAEERRRRLQIARSAIDNARKLHSLQSYRGPVAQADSHASWQGRLADVDHTVLSVASFPRPRTSTRRRGRAHLIGSGNNGAHCDEKGATAPPEKGERNSGPDTASSLPYRSHSPSMVDLDSLKLASFEPVRRRPAAARMLPPRDFSTSNMLPAFAPDHYALSKPTETPYTEPAVRSGEGDQPGEDAEDASSEIDAIKTARLYLEKLAGGPSTRQPDFSIKFARLYLEMSKGDFSTPRPLYFKAVPALKWLLKDMEASESDIDKSNLREKIDLAGTVLERVASFGPPPSLHIARILRSQATRLFRAVSRSCSEKLATTLAQALPLCEDPLGLLFHFMAIVQTGNHQKALRETLLLLSQYPNQHRYSWSRGMLLFRVLYRHAKSQQVDFPQTRQLYLMLREAGLFEQIAVPRSTEYDIRRLMTVLAFECGDCGFARSELQKLDEIDSGGLASDVRLQKWLIVGKADEGRWSEVLSHIEMLRQSLAPDYWDFQLFLGEVADLFSAHGHKSDQLECFLRTAVTEYQLKLENRWIWAVLDNHAAHRQIQSVLSWLQFCAGAGVLMDASFQWTFFYWGRKYWNFSDEMIRKMKRRLRKDSVATRRKIQRRLRKYPFAVRREMKSELRKDSVAARRKERLRTDSVAARRKKRLQTDSVAARRGCDAQRNMAFAGRRAQFILRRAVVKHLKGPDPDTHGAARLIHVAHREGRDVSSALTPLLITQLKRGGNPWRLINDALRMGVRVHDRAYNKAAQALSTRGDHQGAAKMCEVAARENGKGQLLYNQYNFANLVFAYTGIAEYKALQSLLSRLTSEVRWWHGSRTCKESIKLAMKNVARRIILHSANSEYHRQALIHLDNALLHVKSCRPTWKCRQAVSEAYIGLAGRRLDASLKRLRAMQKRQGKSKGRRGRRQSDEVG
ncbi:uncharacterized protein UV8b_01550 [Ustilaginoidea virens]|uniref:Uncharacterized protein n=2 Tax=Ustilaginoidea virens TaxID=1159556 RepID=A0A8E5HLT3_USTVR|nr:uncharacterized protein UV8b_01550 [Ustilaginoidea virens]QUC17309.1 hypothetical protein UV8b_01550 [Ustilaginoidea virens]